MYELAEVRGRLAQRLYELGDGLYELPEALRDVARVLSFNVGRSSFGSDGPQERLECGENARRRRPSNDARAKKS